MKKLYFLTLTIAMMLVLCACNNKATVSDTVVNASVEQNTIKEQDSTDEMDAETEAESALENAEESKASDQASEGESEPSHEPRDIRGFETFTQIVDSLDNDMGYANVPVGDTDVLLISSGVYDDEGIDAAIDSEIYYYKDGTPAYLGYVSAGGTGYPLSVKAGLLYVGSKHEMTTYSVANGELIATEDAYEMYDSEGNATYYYSLKENASDNLIIEDDSKLKKLFADYENAETIEFTKVVK
jgi:hypothetical protein